LENKMTRIGIVIPTLGGRPDWLRGTLESIFTQEGVDIDVVIVTPRPEEVASAAEGTPALIFGSTTPGISAAVNEGWALLPEADYIAWLGDDDLLAPGSLKLSKRALDENPRATSTYGWVRYIDAEDETIFLAKPGRIASAYLPWGKDLVPQPGSLFRRAAVKEAGWLDTSLRFAMDFDLFLRLRVLGQLIYLPTEVAAFRLHPGSITGANRSYEEAEEVRSRAHTSRINRFRRVGSPLRQVVDRLLYKYNQRPGGAVPLRSGVAYVLSLDKIRARNDGKRA
jgi:GT2 family glycosyltransferase